MSFGRILIGPCDIHIAKFERALVIAIYTTRNLSARPTTHVYIALGGEQIRGINNNFNLN